MNKCALLSEAPSAAASSSSRNIVAGLYKSNSTFFVCTLPSVIFGANHSRYFSRMLARFMKTETHRHAIQF